MIIDPQGLAEETRLAIERIVREIGPRPTGSPAEIAARRLCAEALQGQGCAVEEQGFVFPRQPAFFPYHSLAGLAFLACGWLLQAAPWLAFCLPLLVAALPQVHSWLALRLPATVRSANLLALPPGSDLSQLDLLLVAHLDTARAFPRHRLFQQLSNQTPQAMQRLALIFALAGAPPLLGVIYPAAVYVAIGAAGSLAALLCLGLDLWGQLGERGKFAPGANDNASGVGLLLALAGYLKRQPDSTLNVGFLFTGAEETGLHGARAFAASLPPGQPMPYILNIDMIGSGENLRIIRQAGILLPRRTHSGLNALLSRAEPGAVMHDFLRRDGDFSPFLKRGYRAGSVEGSGSAGFWRAYHTQADDLAQIEQAALDRAAGMLLQLLRLLEKSKGGTSIASQSS